MPLIDLRTAADLIEELNDELVNQEHPSRATNGTFSVSTNGYDVLISFEDIHIFDDDSSWTDEEDSLPIEQIILIVAKKRLYAHMDEVEAAINVIENKQQALEREQN